MWIDSPESTMTVVIIVIIVWFRYLVTWLGFLVFFGRKIEIEKERNSLNPR